MTDDGWDQGWDVDTLYCYVREKAAQLGDAKAQCLLGSSCVMYADLKKDNERTRHEYLEEAAKWFRKAAEQDQADAQYSLGRMYSKSGGLPRDYEEALRWFRKAADHGFTNAQVDLGLMYLEGEGAAEL